VFIPASCSGANAYLLGLRTGYKSNEPQLFDSYKLQF
jgi:hypothetical protein